MRPWIRKRDSKRAYYSIINDVRLMHEEDFREYLRMNTSTFQIIQGIKILRVCFCYFSL